MRGYLSAFRDFAIAASLWPTVLFAQANVAPDTAEEGSIEEIAAATTEPRFFSPWVSYLPASSRACHRRALFSTASPARPANWSIRRRRTPMVAHSRQRRRACGVFTIGRSEEGRDIVMLAIADEQGIQDLEQLKEATAMLADPRRIDAPQVEPVIAAARPIYYFNAALHSDETGSTESVLELAYRLAVSEQPMIKRIRENLVVLINPVSNPDGRDKQVEWFYPYLKGKTRPQDAPACSPAVLVQVRLRGHQSRRASAGARDDQGRAQHVPRVAPDHRARPARERAAAHDLEWHRSLQPEHRSDHLRRVSGAELPRSAGHDRLWACRASRPGISARPSRTSISIRWP